MSLIASIVFFDLPLLQLKSLQKPEIKEIVAKHQGPNCPQNLILVYREGKRQEGIIVRASLEYLMYRKRHDSFFHFSIAASLPLPLLPLLFPPPLLSSSQGLTFARQAPYPTASHP